MIDHLPPAGRMLSVGRYGVLDGQGRTWRPTPTPGVVEHRGVVRTLAALESDCAPVIRIADLRLLVVPVRPVLAGEVQIGQWVVHARTGRLLRVWERRDQPGRYHRRCTLDCGTVRFTVPEARRLLATRPGQDVPEPPHGVEST